MNKTVCLFLVTILGIATTFAQKTQEFKIAFGSCSRQDLPQPLWKNITNEQPALWIWIGDNIYGDSNDTAVLRAKYRMLSNNPGYKELKSKVPVIGTWDDHDYGKNDANKTFAIKRESQQIALDFFNEPINSPRRKQEGIYASYDYKFGKSKLKVILLDVRYNQDTLQKAKKGYVPNPIGDILGEEQWRWLEAQLKDSDADAHVIGSGLQIIPNQDLSEKWGNFPRSVERLHNLLIATKAKGVVMISGDRHIGEISKLDVPGMRYPLYEITSSGLTHSSTASKSQNTHRLGKLVRDKNYGILNFTAKKRKLWLTVSIKGEQGTFEEQQIRIR